MSNQEDNIDFLRTVEKCVLKKDKDFGKISTWHQTRAHEPTVRLIATFGYLSKCGCLELYGYINLFAAKE